MRTFEVASNNHLISVSKAVCDYEGFDGILTFYMECMAARDLADALNREAQKAEMAWCDDYDRSPKGVNKPPFYDRYRS